MRNDSAVKSLQDLKGKTISYGYATQEIIKLNVDAMLANAGLTIADMRPVLVPNLIRGVDELIAGRVDVTTFAVGSAKVAEADAALGGVRYLPLNTDNARSRACRRCCRSLYRRGRAGAQPARRAAEAADDAL